MRTRYFVFKDLELSEKIIAKFYDVTRLREETLEELRKDFNLVGFVFAPSGRPDYFLKEMGSEVDKSKFKVGRINRAGNDLTTLEPIGFDVVDRLSLTFIKSLSDVATNLSNSSDPFYRLQDIEAKQEKDLVLIKVSGERSEYYYTPVELVEISESQYTNPDAEQLKTLI
ncbi:hypothetical protein SIPHO067v1_p0051 [Vibrio phage 51E28.1]|nr:hypothetical protein SIPHO067v1_p0051 [Vibrio phage 51E28.1]